MFANNVFYTITQKSSYLQCNVLYTECLLSNGTKNL